MTTVDRMLGISLHYAGEHASARVRLERLLLLPPPPARRSYILRFGFDQRVLARYVLAHLLWVQGFPDQAVRAGQLAVDEAQRPWRELPARNRMCPILRHRTLLFIEMVRSLMAPQLSGSSDVQRATPSTAFDLSNDEKLALVALLARSIASDRYPSSSRVRTLQSILVKLDPQPRAPPYPAPKASPPTGAKVASARRRE
jgi:hypothetical protein